MSKEKENHLNIEGSVVVYPLIESREGTKVVLGQRADNNMWMPVGGGFEEGEHPFNTKETIEREWYEEIGIPLHDVIKMPDYPSEMVLSPYSIGFVYLGRFIGDKLPQPKEGSELINLKAFSMIELCELLEQYKTLLYKPEYNFENIAALVGVSTGIFYHYPDKQEQSSFF